MRNSHDSATPTAGRVPGYVFPYPYASIEHSFENYSQRGAKIRLDLNTSSCLEVLAKSLGITEENWIVAVWFGLLHQLLDQDEISVYEFTPSIAIVYSNIEEETTFQEAASILNNRSQGINVNNTHIPGEDDSYSVGFLIANTFEDTHLTDQVDFLLIVSRGSNKDFFIGYETRLAPQRALRHLELLISLLQFSLINSKQIIRKLSAVSSAEQRILLETFLDTVTDYPRDSHISKLVHYFSENSPERLAVLDSHYSLSRGKLIQQASNLAEHLLASGLTPGEPVALLMCRDTSMVVASLAVLLAGGVYCPIDPSYPLSRVSYYLEDSQARFILVSGKESLILTEALENSSSFTGSIFKADMRSISRLRDVSIRGLIDKLKTTPESPAYLMYTSGTTGQPKGVLVTHRGVIRLVCGVNYVQLDEDSRVLQAGAIGFDAATFEIWGALLNGAQLHIVERDSLLSSQRLGDFFKTHGTNVALITSSLFALLANENPSVFSPLSTLVIGGDVAPAKQIHLVRQTCPRIVIVNAYGPTENAVISTTHEVTDNDGLVIPIGRPISNTTAFILSRSGQIQPIGVPGELYVGGDGIGPGYFGKPKQTFAAFIPSPFNAEDTLYRTGDLAYWRSDGQLVFIGRRDHQVKIRGFRVELGEIERQMLSTPGVKEAVILWHKPGENIEPQLVAYFCASTIIEIGTFRSQLTAALPTHMVPMYIYQLPVMPLTINGKVDRNALPRPDSHEAESLPNKEESAANETLLLIISELSDLLSHNNIQSSDNFLALGASSLTAALLASRLELKLGIRCPVGIILSSFTLNELGHYLDLHHDMALPAYTCFVQGTKQSTYIASASQKQIYIEQIKSPASTAYNLPIEICFDESPDLERLQQSLEILIKRQDVLRTSFLNINGSIEQSVAEVLTPKIIHLDGIYLTEKKVTNWVQPFDLSVAPLWRIALVRNDKNVRLLCDFHHILVDAISIDILLTEWQALYNGIDLAVPSFSFGDYITWLGSDEAIARFDHGARFWHNIFQNRVPAHDLPTDYSRSKLRSFRGAVHRFEIETQRVGAIHAFALRLRITPFLLLICSYALWLASATGNRNVTIGTPAAGRFLPGTENVIGMFVNTVCMRFDTHTTDTVDTWLTNMSKQIGECLDHQDYPFSRLVEELDHNRRFDRHPLFDSMFALQNSGLNKNHFLGGSVRWRPSYTGATIFDLNLQIEEEKDNMYATWAFNADLFQPHTIFGFSEAWILIIDRLITSADIPISEFFAPKEPPFFMLPEIDFNF